ncbi:AraC family transcriptional regulator [Pontibacter sp. FD36]|uniref:AraC family transcriptional regulator n=1 Tax=Pontibacter sp. FD36 TaxID=2789860 RepID=UPI0018A9F55C|nr:AraC family transcriptional regulator [Pontibacter sp. FD36]MBF8962342.1 AraC family transcriptional regulator [Pontibacter sp. FD36]
MPIKHQLQQLPTLKEQALTTLVEHRSAYTLESCELNVFETHQAAEKVSLVFDNLVLTSMLRGKKVMHLFGKQGFDYLPGESVIVPPNELMKIDFPEAERDNPTQCIALAISQEQIQTTVALLNERFPKVERNACWSIDQEMFHLVNNQDLADIINRLIRISINEKNREKDVLAGLALRELLVRLMQTQARQLFESNYVSLATNNRFAHIIKYIKESIREKIDIDKLSDKACMSRASFFRKFKEEFGYTPADYILKERIRLAKDYLRNPLNSVTQACYMAGFQNLNYFIRAFKKEVGLTPKSFQQQHI